MNPGRHANAARPLSAFAGRVNRRSREAKWERYRWTFPPQPGERVLDVGVSGTEGYVAEDYFLERYPYEDQLTGLGLNDLSGLAKRFPRARFVQADACAMPFQDGAFDVVHSNAVIEHVGPKDRQRAFMAELVRVGRAGFVTTPSRWFPVDSHTLLPLLHWLPRRVWVRALARLGRADPSVEWETWLLSSRRFLNLVPDATEFRLEAQRVAGLRASLIVTFRRP